MKSHFIGPPLEIWIVQTDIDRTKLAVEAMDAQIPPHSTTDTFAGLVVDFVATLWTTIPVAALRWGWMRKEIEHEIIMKQLRGSAFSILLLVCRLEMNEQFRR
jgi:hypothetical protein